MSGRTAAWLAWTACALSLVLTALTVLLIVLLLRSDTPIYYYWLETSMVALVHDQAAFSAMDRCS